MVEGALLEDDTVKTAVNQVAYSTDKYERYAYQQAVARVFLDLTGKDNDDDNRRDKPEERQE